MNSLKLKLIGAAILAVSLFFCVRWVAGLPESWREEGRVEERETYRKTSTAAVAERDRDFKQIAADLKTERENHEKSKVELDAKFNNYVADVRAGRVAGLRINRSSVCPSGAEKAPSTSGTVEEATVRLPREIEEGLFRFARNRDQIILDFEAFKTEVRVAKCFAD